MKSKGAFDLDQQRRKARIRRLLKLSKPKRQR